jgi:hypothetical protein
VKKIDDGFPRGGFVNLVSQTVEEILKYLEVTNNI